MEQPISPARDAALPGNDPATAVPPVSEPEIQAHLTLILRNNMRLIANSLSVLYIIFCLAHLLILPPDIAAKLAWLAAFTAVAMLALGWWLKRPDYPVRFVNLSFGFGAILIWLNSLAHLALTKDPNQTTNLIILICAAGFVTFSLRWLAVVVGLALTGWVYVAVTTVHEDWLHFAFALLVASGLSYYVNTYRIRVFRRLVIASLTEAQRSASMAAALATTEKARQEAVTSRQAVQDMLTAMQRAEERFRSFTELEGIAIHERGEILDANPALAEMFGYDAMGIIRMNVLGLFAPESQQAAWEHIVLNNESPLEVIGQHKDGTGFPVEICTTGTTWRNRPASVISLRDISERQKVMQLLRESEARYRALFDFTPLPMAVIDRETRKFVAVNQAAIRHYGWSREEFLNLPITALSLPEDQAETLDKFNRHPDSLTQTGIVTQQTKCGRVIKVELTTHEITWAERPARLVLASDITDRLNRERNLRDSDERHRRLFDISPLPTWVYDLDTLKFLAVNQAAINHYGFSRAEFMAMTTLDIRPPEEHQRFHEFIRNRPKGPQHGSIFRHRRKDGSLILVEGTSDDLDYAGKNARLVITSDVTAREQAAQNLRESEERYRKLFEISPIPMWVFDINTLEFLAVNKAAVRHYGYARREFLAMKATDIRPPDEVKRFVKLASRDPGGLKNSGIWRHVKKDGSIIEVVISSHEMTFAGRTARLVVASDITVRKRIEESLRKYTSRLRVLRDMDQAIMAAHSPQAIAEAILPGLKRLIPFDRASVSLVDQQTKEIEFLTVWPVQSTAIKVGTRISIGQNWPDWLRGGRPQIISDLQDNLVNDAVMAARRAAGIRSLIIVPLTVGNDLIGTLNLGARKANFYSEEQADLAFDVAHTLALAIQNARLYEAERQARSAAETADRLKDEFLATVSHELRTPLNAIVGWNHLLRSRQLSQEVTDRALETIERNARAQSQLINDLLDVSRIISGRLRLNIATVDLLPIIQETLISVRPAAEAKSINLITRLDASAGLVTGDPDRLQQVLWNLLQNAIKFTPDNGVVTISLSAADNHLQLVVSDTGKGISPEFLPYIFERFRQADSSSTRSYGGLGLGLSIVRNLVELHGGIVTANSPGENQGATFTIRLPLARLHVSDSGLRIEGAMKDDQPSSGPVSPLAGKRILVVEDENDTRDLLSLLLSQPGAQTITVASASEALPILSQWAPDLLISDLAMPDKDGYWLIRQVRNLPQAKGGRVPAIALTASARPEDQARVLDAGFQMHIPKPFDPGELVEAVTEFLSRTTEKGSLKG